MDSDIKQRMAQLKRTSAGLIFAEFLKERIDENTKQLVMCNENTFRQQQGKVLALQELVKYLES
jgi:tellurite resistance protein